jgi:hypothetical protein
LGTWLDQPSEHVGSGVGIAAFGTAISGMVPGAIVGFLSTWLVYRYGKRAMVALLKFLKEVAIRGLDRLRHAARRYLAGIAIGNNADTAAEPRSDGTAISGMVPGVIVRFLSTWLVYRYGERR